jgi:hypothetical protein
VVFNSLTVWIFAPNMAGRLKEAVYLMQLRSQNLTVFIRRSREKTTLYDNMKLPLIAVTYLRMRQLVSVMNTSI